jgi:zinc protease
VSPSRRLTLVAALSLALVGAAASAGAAEGDDEPLPSDPSVVRGALPNGVRYLVARHPAAAGRAVVWMRVDVGSLDEEEGQSGLAHFVEHMAFTGTRSYPRGSVTRRLEELGLTFGKDENAITALRATTYKLTLPQATPAALDEAVRIMADFAYRREPTAAALAHERAVILAEMRAADGYTERVDDKVFAATLAGARAGRRIPLGAARVIEEAGLRELDRFMARWYRPERTTILVAGDVDPELVAAAVARELSDFRARTPPPADPGVHAGALRGQRVAIVTDPEQPFAEVRLVSPRAASAVRTVGDYRRALAARLAVTMTNERLREIEDRGSSFDDAYAEIEPMVEGLVDHAAVYGFARPGAWRPLLRELVAAVDGTAQSGFTLAELERARSAMLAELRARAAGASTRPVSALAGEMTRDLGSSAPLLSAAQRLSLAERLAPEIDVAVVNAAFRDWFAGQERLLAVILPARPGLSAPTAAEVARLAARARSGHAGAAPPRGTAPPDALLDEEPQPGEVVEETDDPPSGVTSLTLGNGVRVHLRPMDDRKGEVRVQITMAGGELLEGAGTRGLSEAAALAFETPATERLTPAAIRSHLAGREIELSGCACDGDAITAELRAAPADLEKGMRLLHLVLTRGRITAAALQVWKDRALEAAQETSNDPELRVDAEMTAMLGSGDARVRPLRAAQIARVTLPAAQAWLERHLGSAPLEVAMVGDASRDELGRLARKYLGALPARPRADARLEALRQPQPAALPREGALTVDSVTPRAAIELAFRGPDGDERGARDALDLAAASLADRLRQALRVQRGLTYSVDVDTEPQAALRGTGAIVVSLSTDPRRAREAARLARQVVERFAAEGPTPDELATARRQVANRRAVVAHRVSAWADRLAVLDYRRRDLGDLVDPDGAGSVTAGEVRAVVARYVRGGERSVTMVATPKSNLVFGGSDRGR